MKRLMRSIAVAGRGVRMAVESQPNMRIHGVAAAGVIGAAFFFDISAFDWCVVILAMGLVISMELINSSIEGLVDLLEPERRPLAGKIKDMAAGGVLIAAICALVAGLLVFPKYFAT